MIDAADSPEERLAASFARQVERWSAARGAEPSAREAAHEAARRVSLATADGQVCLSLATLAAEHGHPAGETGWRTALLASAVVSEARAPSNLPLVLDDAGRLYLHRHFDLERRLAARLHAAASVPDEPIDAAAGAMLDSLFGPDAAEDGVVNDQKRAARLALQRRLVVISGGPGTGKTTTVVNLLACLLAQAPDARVALAAPTGKAAARMTEAILGRAGHLPPDLRARLPSESFTIHRLLGSTPTGFSHDARRPLPVDVLVVDEASMLDLALATRLLEAVPPSARVILLGDGHQLAAVEAGAVFSELCAADAVPGALVTLRRNFRFGTGPGIARLAGEIGAGRAGDALATLADPAQASALRWLADPGIALVDAIAEGYAAYFRALQRDPADVASVAAAFARYRVLCATRLGARGVAAVNAQVGRLAQAAAGGRGAGAPVPTWYAGRPVMVLRNDYLLKLFNGDIGLALPAPDGALAVHFPDLQGGWRCIAPARLPPHETAWAMTIHKSQGSEFDSVLVLLPEHRSRVLTRELLYTGVTRARERVTIGATAEVLTATIAAATHRHSGLLARLRELRGA